MDDLFPLVEFSSDELGRIGWNNSNDLLMCAVSRMMTAEIEHRIRMCELSYDAYDELINDLSEAGYEINIGADVEPDLTCISETFDIPTEDSESEGIIPIIGEELHESENQGSEDIEDDWPHTKVLNFLSWRFRSRLNRDINYIPEEYIATPQSKDVYVFETGMAKYDRTNRQLHSFVSLKQELKPLTDEYPYNLIRDIFGTVLPCYIPKQSGNELVTKTVDEMLDTLTEAETQLLKVIYKYHISDRGLLYLMELPVTEALLWGISKARSNTKAMRKLRHPSRAKHIRRCLQPPFDQHEVTVQTGSKLEDVEFTYITALTSEIQSLLDRYSVATLDELRKLHIPRTMDDMENGIRLFYDLHFLQRMAEYPWILKPSTLDVELFRDTMLKNIMPEMHGRVLAQAYSFKCYLSSEDKHFVIVICDDNKKFLYSIETNPAEPIKPVDRLDFTQEILDRIVNILLTQEIAHYDPEASMIFCFACAATLTITIEKQFYTFLGESFRKELALLQWPIEELDLKVRSYNGLKRRGVLTVSDILALSSEEFRSIKRLGETSVNEILEKIEMLSLRWVDSVTGLPMRDAMIKMGVITPNT